MNRIKLFESFSNDAVDINKFTYSKDSLTFSAEVSELKGILQGGEKTVKIHNPKTNKTVEFTLYKTDMDGSKEDTYGWRYENKETGLKLLIIND